MINACNGPSGSPCGAGIRLTSCSSRPCTPSPVFALTGAASCAGMPMSSSISWITLAGSADGRAAALLDETVGQGRLAVIHVSNDGKIADILHRRRGPAGANPALYRPAVKADALIDFFRVQPAVAEDFPREHQHGNLVTVT